LIVGDDGSSRSSSWKWEQASVGDEVISYIKEHWTVPKSIGRYTVWMKP
jgi:hypothetical protein